MSDAVPRNQFQHQLKPVPLLASSFQAEVPYACPVKLDSGASEVHVRLQEVTMYNIRDPVSGGIKSNYGIAYLRLNGVGWFHVENGLGLVFEHFRGLQNSAIVKSGQQILTTQYWGKVKQNLLRAYGYDDAKTYVEPYEAMYREYQKAQDSGQTTLGGAPAAIVHSDTMISRDEHGLAVTEYSHHFKSGSELMRKAMAHFSDKKLTWTYDQQDGSLVAHNTIERFKVVGRVVNTWIPLHGNALTLAVSISSFKKQDVVTPGGIDTLGYVLHKPSRKDDYHVLVGQTSQEWLIFEHHNTSRVGWRPRKDLYFAGMAHVPAPIYATGASSTAQQAQVIAAHPSDHIGQLKSSARRNSLEVSALMLTLLPLAPLPPRSAATRREGV